MFVKTRSSLLNNRTENSCETVVFKSKKKCEAVPHKNKPANTCGEVRRKESELDLKKLRYEVIKFGSSGFDGTKKEESRIALAVALGAKPPKRKYKNYTEILSEKKAEAKNKDNDIMHRTKLFGRKGKSKFKRNNGKVGGGNLLGSYGKVKQEK